MAVDLSSGVADRVQSRRTLILTSNTSKTNLVECVDAERLKLQCDSMTGDATIAIPASNVKWNTPMYDPLLKILQNSPSSIVTKIHCRFGGFILHSTSAFFSLLLKKIFLFLDTLLGFSKGICHVVLLITVSLSVVYSKNNPDSPPVSFCSNFLYNFIFT